MEYSASINRDLSRLHSRTSRLWARLLQIGVLSLMGTALPLSAAETPPEQTAREIPSEQTTEGIMPEKIAVETAPVQTDVEIAPEQATVETAPEQPTKEIAPKQTTVETASEQTTKEIEPEQATGEIAPEKTAVEITPEEIVENADHIRFPTQGFQVDVKITTTKPEQNPEVKEYRILSKGNDRTLLMTTAPAIDKGTLLLMRDHDLWAFLPNLSQPVRLPLSAKLTGEVSNGDIARANFKGDYDATLLGVESIDEQAYYKLELTAARRGVTYKRVLYWVNQGNYRPFKAEFYSVSDRLIKTCHYLSYKEMAGSVRPTQLVMVDGVTRQGRSVLDYSGMALRELPDKVFTKNYLKKLSK